MKIDWKKWTEPQAPWDIIKQADICTAGGPKEEKNGVERILEEIMAENFPNLRKETDIQIWWLPIKMNPKKSTPRHITIKMLKVEDKRELLKQQT